MDVTRLTRVMEHTCGFPIVVTTDPVLGFWRYLGPDQQEFMADCPRCKRRIKRTQLRAIGGELVRGGKR